MSNTIKLLICASAMVICSLQNAVIAMDIEAGAEDRAAAAPVAAEAVHVHDVRANVQTNLETILYNIVTVDNADFRMAHPFNAMESYLSFKSALSAVDNLDDFPTLSLLITASEEDFEIEEGYHVETFLRKLNITIDHLQNNRALNLETIHDYLLNFLAKEQNRENLEAIAPVLGVFINRMSHCPAGQQEGVDFVNRIAAEQE